MRLLDEEGRSYLLIWFFNCAWHCKKVLIIVAGAVKKFW